MSKSQNHHGNHSTGGLSILICTSADLRVSGTSTDFKHPIRPFIVDSANKYEVALVSIDYPAPTGESVFVSSNLVGFSRVGSGTANTLFRIPPQPKSTHTHYTQSQSIVEWYPLASDRISFVEVKLTNSAGVVIPPLGSVLLTVAIRKISAIF
jgi:hypothetical protein